MKIVVVADDALKKEMLAQGLHHNVQVAWISRLNELPVADCYVDLLFTPVTERIEVLKNLQPALIIVNSVTSATELPEDFVRLNGWFTFLRRPLIEASGNNAEARSAAERIFNSFNKTASWVPHVPGFISARIISMIINEAYFALAEKVSTRENIDTAMKLGTNYPFGPFEWAEKIGLKNVHDLLNVLSKNNSRYKPAELLSKEASL